MRPLLCVITLLATAAMPVAAQTETIVGSPHDLSAGGPGPVRATFEDQVCIFCHTPHNASPIQPLWNRYLPVDNYRIYASRALDAVPGQPTGASKMCLSCHDGTIAIGVVFSRDTPILLSGGVTVMPDGPSNLGTDLSDDHPISFRYDSALAAQDQHLLDPGLLPEELRLDANGELQCTTCHDPHDDSRGNFLTMHNFNSQLCIACHQISTTTVTNHQDCSACHQPHSAPSGPYLLRAQNVAETCLLCHTSGGGGHGAPDISRDLAKPSIHETYSQVDPPDPQFMHTSCTSCHDPHTMHKGSAQAPLVHPSMGDIDGVNSSGSPVPAATYEYEVCFKCHADQQAVSPYIQRLAPDNNTRLQFSPGAVSFHPVEAPGKSSDVPSLRPGWTTSSMVHCSDCHSSDRGGGSGGHAGTHGSNFFPLLSARYETADYTTESESAYALCYGCHDRNSILGDESFPEHDKHIRDERTPCSACHTGHGIASGQGSTTNNSHLINFDTAIVYPNNAGRLEFRDLGYRAGECFLSCHGENHDPESYPDD